MKNKLIQKIINKCSGKKKLRRAIEEHVDKMISVINNTDKQGLKKILSCYAERYEPETEDLARIIDTFCKKYNVEFVFDNVFGYKQFFDKGYSSKFFFTYNFPSDCYPECCFLKSLDRKFDVSVDVGANKCAMTTFLSGCSEKVFAFEPCRKTYNLGLRNLKINNIQNVEFCNAAISDTIGEVEFFDYGEQRHGHNSLLNHSPEALESSYTVHSLTLDSFLKDKNIEHVDCLKIDVEGFERQVLKGAKHYLENKLIDIVLFEVSRAYVDESAIAELFGLFDGAYKIFDFNMKEIKLSDLDNVYHMDLVAINIDKVDCFKNKAGEY